MAKASAGLCLLMVGLIGTATASDSSKHPCLWVMQSKNANTKTSKVLTDATAASRMLAATTTDQTDDPFDLRNQRSIEVELAPVAATPVPKAAKPSAAAPIEFDVRVEPKVVRRGQTTRITITGVPAPGYHTYSFTRKTVWQDGLGTNLGKLTHGSVKGLQPLWPTVESATEVKKLPVDQKIETYHVHKESFTLTQDIMVLPDAAVGDVRLPITVEVLVCSSRCVPVRTTLEANLEVSAETPVALTAELQQRLKEPRPEAELVEAGSGPTGLLAFILAGIFWGAISLMTPCVFPMIPITVSYFLKQSEKEHHRPVGMALVYCLTIVLVLTTAAVALLSFFRYLSVNPLMNIAIGGLFIGFALSLFGWFEIELPSGLARFTSAREGKGGLVGTIFMALTFTIISFACVAPFLGGFGGTAANSQISLAHRVLGGLAFSLTFASPFFVLALFPTLLKKLPKSGAWLNTVKVTMGFMELAAALKFLRAGELVLLPEPMLFTYDLVLGLYVALTILCAFYLLGIFRLPHDSPAGNLSVPRMLLSFAFLGLAFYLLPALFKSAENGLNQRPSGAVFAWLDSFMLPDDFESDLPWTGNLHGALADAGKHLDGKSLVFVDFTGKTCVNCKLNERNVFTRNAVQDLLNRYRLVALYTDVVPNRFYSEREQETFGNGTARQAADAVRNLQLQRSTFNTEELPLYVILRPTDSKGGFEEVARFDEGLIRNEGKFRRFLEHTLAAEGAVAQKMD